MWGAIIGDLAGSVYEYSQYKQVSLIDVKKIIEDDSFFSDDTILTIAIYDAIIRRRSYEDCLKYYGNLFMRYVPDTCVKERFNTVFGKRFAHWVRGEEDNRSIGNGAMMRISGIGKMFNTEEEVVKQAMLATKPSHNTIEAIECARTVALVIYYARMGLTKGEILKKLNIENLVYIPFVEFNKTCYETLGNCLYAAFSAHNFEEAIRMIVSMGGDTDTNGAIVGAMAEALYGVPEYLVNIARKKIPKSFSKILDSAYSEQYEKV